MPKKLQEELLVWIHSDIIQQIPLFQDREKAFISLVGPMLKPGKLKEDNYLHQEGVEYVNEIYFIYNGIVGYVLKKRENMVYATAEKGDYIGLVDLIPSVHEIKSWNMGKPKRKFTVMCITDWCEYLTLLVQDLDKIKTQYPLIMDELFVNTISWNKRLRALK